MGGDYGRLTGLVNGAVVSTPLADVVAGQKALDPWMLELAGVLAA
jgi:hypothetical protein